MIRSTLLFFTVAVMLLTSLQLCTGGSSSLPYQAADFCNHSPHDLTLHLHTHFQDQPYLMHVEDIPAESCVEVEVLSGAEYSALATGSGGKSFFLHPLKQRIVEGVNNYAFTAMHTENNDQVGSDASTFSAKKAVKKPSKSSNNSKPKAAANNNNHTSDSNFAAFSILQPLSSEERASDRLRIKIWNLINHEIIVLLEDPNEGSLPFVVGQIEYLKEEYVMAREGTFLLISFTSDPNKIYDRIEVVPGEVR